MKKIISITALVLFLFSCEKKESELQISACGVNNPQKNIEWLSNLIKKAENDKTANYLGTIWLEKYDDNDIFVTNMAMESGGVAFYFFDCQGNSIVPPSVSFMKFKTVVYTNVPN